MQIFFCTQCGSRFSEDTLSPRQQEEQDFTRVYCSKCENSLLAPTTFNTRAVSRANLAIVDSDTKAMPPLGRPSAVGLRTISGQARISGKNVTGRMTRDAAPSPAAGAKVDDKIWIIAGAGGAGVLLILFYFIFGGAKTESKVSSSSNAKLRDKDAVSVDLALNRALPVNPPADDAATAVKVVDPNAGLSLEERADLAFTQLRKNLSAVPKEDEVGRTKLCQEFLKDFGSTLLGSRVRAMMSSFNKAPGNAGGTPAMPPSAPANNQDAQGLKSDEQELARVSLKDFSGGEFFPMFLGRGMDGRAIWGARSPNCRMEARFNIAAIPAKEAFLNILTMKHDLPNPALFKVELNDQMVYQGRDKNGEELWKYNRYSIPAGVLKAGENIVRITCTEDSDNFHRAPWFMLNALSIVTQK